MRNFKRIFTCTIVFCVAGIVIGAGAVRRGTSVLHYMTRNALGPTEAGSNVAGSLRLQLKEQGHSALQKFNLNATGLQPDTAYLLLAVVGNDSNAVPAATVTTDRNGKLRVSYMERGQGKGNPNKQLPEMLNPLTDVRAVGLATLAETQTLALAWVNASPTFQYLVKRNLTPADTNGTAAGSISLKANANTVNFRLLADGLSVSNSYFLALNSVVVETAAADASGQLRIEGWPASAPAVLDLQTLSLLDGSSNVVLSTSLPR